MGGKEPRYIRDDVSHEELVRFTDGLNKVEPLRQPSFLSFVIMTGFTEAKRIATRLLWRVETNPEELAGSVGETGRVLFKKGSEKLPLMVDEVVNKTRGTGIFDLQEGLRWISNSIADKDPFLRCVESFFQGGREGARDARRFRD